MIRAAWLLLFVGCGQGTAECIPGPVEPNGYTPCLVTVHSDGLQGDAGMPVSDSGTP